MGPATADDHMAGDVRFFERFAPVYDLVMPRADGTAIRSGLAVAEGPVERVVDLGGGTGRAIREVTASGRLVLDPARGMLRRVPADVDRLRGSATSLPLRDGSIDAVLIVDALHHMPPVARVFSEVRRVLRPGGVVVVIDFNPTTVRGRLLVAAEHLIGFNSVFYSPTDLGSHLDTAGFTPEVIDGGFAYVVAGRVPPDE